MSDAHVSRIRFVAGGGQAVVSRIRFVAVDSVAAVVSRIRFAATGLLVIDANAAQTIAPFTEAILRGVIVSGDYDTATWTQTSGPTVTLVPDPGDPLTARFTWLPVWPGAATGNTTFGFRFTATLAGNPDATDTTTVTITPHQGFWKYVGSVLTGVGIRAH